MLNASERQRLSLHLDARRRCRGVRFALAVRETALCGRGGDASVSVKSAGLFSLPQVSDWLFETAQTLACGGEAVAVAYSSLVNAACGALLEAVTSLGTRLLGDAEGATASPSSAGGRVCAQVAHKKPEELMQRVRNNTQAERLRG